MHSFQWFDCLPVHNHIIQRHPQKDCPPFFSPEGHQLHVVLRKYKKQRNYVTCIETLVFKFTSSRAVEKKPFLLSYGIQ